MFPIQIYSRTAIKYLILNLKFYFIGYRPLFLKISRNLVTLIKQWEVNTAHDDEKTLKKKKKTLIPESVIFVRPVAR